MLKFFFVLILLQPVSAISNSAPVPQSMAALGDSMSAGVLSPYPRQQAILPWHHLRILWNSLQLLATGKRESLAFRHLSWSTGHRIDSHYSRLKDLNPKLVDKNFAQPSAFSKDIMDLQIPALVQWSQQNLNQDLPDYVTLLIGHNDLCGKTVEEMTSVRDFQKNIHSSIQFLVSQKTKARILVVPLARIDTLPETVGNSFVVPIKGLQRCQQVWKTIPLCTTLTQRESAETQKIVKTRLQDFNKIIKSEVARARAKHGDRIRLASVMESYQPQPNDVAIDCFHANKDAQNRISAKTWSSTWWDTPSR